MKNLIIIFLSSIFLISCDPPRLCPRPQCIYTDVEAQNIAPTISGNLDSIIQLGDTLKLTLNLPDTIHTSNYGDFIFGQLLQSSFFSITASVFDSIGVDGYAFGANTIPTYITYGKNINEPGGNTSGGAEEWDFATRKFECYVVPNKKGLCIIEFITGRIEMKATDGQEWLVMTSHYFENIDRHEKLFVSWWPEDKQKEAWQTANQYKNKYYFEVR